MFFEFSFRCFGLLWLLIIKKPFLAFTDVLRKIFGSLTQKVWEFLSSTGLQLLSPRLRKAVCV
jgi:hypothetical protein